jgi:hypothetical protein
MHRPAVVLTCLVAFLLPGLASAQMATPPPLPSQQPTAGTPDILGTVFSEIEKRIIREVLGAGRVKDERSRDDDGAGKAKKSKKGKGGGGGRGREGEGLPPGLAKRDRLPPGLARQLKRHGRLPPGLQKRALPKDLQDRLPDAPEGTERAIVGNDVVLIQKGTNLVLDILKGVLKDVLTK